MESWRKVWKEGIVPVLSIQELNVLQNGLRINDPHLIQGKTIHCSMGFDVESACAIAYCGWKGHSLKTTSEVEDYFSYICSNIDKRLNEPAVSRYFLNWFDDTPRDIMIANLLVEVELALKERL